MFSYKIEFPASVRLKTNKKEPGELGGRCETEDLQLETRPHLLVLKRLILCLVANRNGWDR
jgi:hypothetical protein